MNYNLSGGATHKNVKMIKIAVCICTRNRQEGLVKLLGSIENMERPPETDIRIIIVENDIKNYSESLVRAFASESKFPIEYYLEPRQGIVYARNRSVKEAGNCDFCCFTDDDQVVSSDWISELLKCQLEFDADGVAGPTKPCFVKKVPLYLEEFYQPDSYQYGTIVQTGFTGCLLLRKRNLEQIEGPFDLRLNLSGGEDTFLTRQITDLGGTIRFNPNAVAYEFIPENRASLRFVINRTFMKSNTRLYVNGIMGKDFNKLELLPRLVMRFTYGLIIIIPYFIFSKRERFKGLMKIVNAAGGFAYIFGKRSRFYS